MTKLLPLVIPLHTIRHQQIGGTESSLYNLVKGLHQAAVPIVVSFADTQRLAPEFQEWIKDSKVAIRKTLRIPGPKSGRFLEESIFECGRSDDSWVLYPNYFYPPTIKRCRPTAVLLHDIQYKLFPHYHSERRRQWLDYYLPKMFSKADIVFLISEFERQQVYEFFGDNCGKKCEVIYNAIDFDRFSVGLTDSSDLSRTEAPYILTVCHHFPHKNVATLLRAFEIVANVDPNVQLYMVGKQTAANTEFIHRSLSDNVAERVKLLGFVSDTELGGYYRNASVFALPSLYEGFGMPAIEAMGLGVPTLLSDIPSLREVTLGKANYVAAPTDAGMWATSILAMIRSSTSRAAAAELRSEISSLYEPAKVARRLVSYLN